MFVFCLFHYFCWLVYLFCAFLLTDLPVVALGTLVVLVCLS